MKVLKKTIGMRNPSPTHRRRLLYMSEEDLTLLEGIKKVQEERGEVESKDLNAVAEALITKAEASSDVVCPEVPIDG